MTDTTPVASDPAAIKFDGSIIGGLLKAIGGVVLSSGLAEQFREPAKALALDLFDRVVVPHNFPNIPDFLEPRIKDAVRAALPPLIDKMFDALKGPDATKTVEEAVQKTWGFLKAEQLRLAQTAA